MLTNDHSKRMETRQIERWSVDGVPPSVVADELAGMNSIGFGGLCSSEEKARQVWARDTKLKKHTITITVE